MKPSAIFLWLVNGSASPKEIGWFGGTLVLFPSSSRGAFFVVWTHHRGDCEDNNNNQDGHLIRARNNGIVNAIIKATVNGSIQAEKYRKYGSGIFDDDDDDGDVDGDDDEDNEDKKGDENDNKDDDDDSEETDYLSIRTGMAKKVHSDIGSSSQDQR